MAQASPGENYYHSLKDTCSQANPADELDLVLSMLIEDAARSGNLHRRQSRYACRQGDRLDHMSLRRHRRNRTTFTTEQIAELEEVFLENPYLTTARLAELSSRLILRQTQIQTWFKNRRRRQKLQAQEDYLYGIMQPSPPPDVMSPRQSLSPVTVLDPTSNLTTTDITALSDPLDFPLSAPMSPSVLDPTSADGVTSLSMNFEPLPSEILAAAASVLLDGGACSNDPPKANDDIHVNRRNVNKRTTLPMNNYVDSSSNDSFSPPCALESPYCSVNTNAPAFTANGKVSANRSTTKPPTRKENKKPTNTSKDTAAVSATEVYQELASNNSNHDQNSQLPTRCKVHIGRECNHSRCLPPRKLRTRSMVAQPALRRSERLKSMRLPPMDDLFKRRSIYYEGDSSFGSGSESSTDSDDLWEGDGFVLTSDVVGGSATRGRKRLRDSPVMQMPDDIENSEHVNNGSHSTGGSSVAMLDQNTEAAYKKHRKLTDTTDPNHLCTMDNLRHSITAHRKVTRSSQQFAYCK